MADPVTMSDIANLIDQIGTIRREAGVNTNEVVREGLKESFSIRGDVKDTRYDVNTRIVDSTNSLSQQVDAIDDTLSAALNTISRDTMDVRAQITAVGYQVRDGFVAAAKDSEINALKTQIETAKQTTYLSDKIDADGEKTRGLIASLREAELNRMLIERNSELVEERHGRRFWHDRADFNHSQGQWAALNNQMQAFGSQLQEARQGMVNFGTMAGVGQTSSQNNV